MGRTWTKSTGDDENYEEKTGDRQGQMESEMVTDDSTMTDAKKTSKQNTEPVSDSNEALLEEMKKNDEKNAPTVTGGDYPWAAQGTPVIRNEENDTES
jgi:spore germination cell wall hydrolase CwlJ-like protein